MTDQLTGLRKIVNKALFCDEPSRVLGIRKRGCFETWLWTDGIERDSTKSNVRMTYRQIEERIGRNKRLRTYINGLKIHLEFNPQTLRANYFFNNHPMGGESVKEGFEIWSIAMAAECDTLHPDYYEDTDRVIIFDPDGSRSWTEYPAVWPM